MSRPYPAHPTAEELEPEVLEWVRDNGWVIQPARFEKFRNWKYEGIPDARVKKALTTLVTHKRILKGTFKGGAIWYASERDRENFKRIQGSPQKPLPKKRKKLFGWL